MSLIDEALKRTREQGKTDAVPGTPAPPKDPWAYAPMPQEPSRVALKTVALIAAGILIAGAVVYLELKGRGGAPPGAFGSASPSTTAAAGASKTPAARSSEGSLPTVEVPPPPRFRQSEAPSIGANVPAPAAAGGAAASRGGVGQSVPNAASARAAARTPEPVALGSPPPGTRPRMPASIQVASGSPRIEPRTASASASSNSRPPAPEPMRAAAPVAGPPSAPPRAAVPRGPARTYVGSFAAPNGAKIDLGGIVFSETPVALLNGHVLPPGGMVEGLTVLSIEENRVELEGDGVHVYLALK